MIRFVFAILALSLLPFATVNAQNLAQDLQQLTTMNRINPLQNPDFSRSENVLERRIIDRKHKVIGEIRDITLRENGSIENLVVDFNRLRLGSEVFLNYRQSNVNAMTDGYEIPMDTKELEEFFPTMLASMATASGEDSNLYSTQRLIGIDIRRASGRKIGSVEEVLFTESGSRVQALFVELSFGIHRGEKIAIPFRSVTFQEPEGRLYAEISDSLADAVIQLADD